MNLAEKKIPNMLKKKISIIIYIKAGESALKILEEIT